MVTVHCEYDNVADPLATFVFEQINMLSWASLIGKRRAGGNQRVAGVKPASGYAPHMDEHEAAMD